MIQRRTVVGIVFAIAISLLAGCGFESPDVEASEHAAIQAADFSVSAIRVRDAFVTSTGGSVYLVVTFVNDGTNPDALTSITSPLGPVTINAAGSGSTATIGGGLALPPKGVATEVDTPGLAPSGPVITIAAATPPVVGGYVPMTFVFGQAGTSASEQVPVVPPGETTSPTQAIPTGTASVPAPEGVHASD